MNQAVVIVICLAYIMGLLSTILPWGIYAVVTIGLLLATIAQQIYRQNLRRLTREMTASEQEITFDEDVV